jgi:hypothetical protein
MSRVRDLADLTCKEIVELLGDYQGRALDAADSARFEQHLFACTWCMTYAKQMERTIEVVGALRDGEPPADTTTLAALFRAHKDKRGAGR